ncbi:MAG: hypothetical protein HXS54_00620 [Theionarchaea archaeon]|nr:hypothetical protein [Theionarchaea archaeon]
MKNRSLGTSGGGRIRTTLEQRRKQYRIIYELLFKDPRIHKSVISSVLGEGRTATLRMKEAYDHQYIVGPEIRLRSFQNLKEYMYFVTCRHPEMLYLKYREDMNVSYHAKTRGFCDLWIISKKNLDIEGKIVHEGYRSDFYVSYAPDRSWEESLEIARKKIDEFRPKEYETRFFIKEHFRETVDWTEEDRQLYKYFKYNLRKPFTPVIKDLKITRDELNNFFEKLPACCTIFTDYFPDSLPSYDPYLFMVETD